MKHDFVTDESGDIDHFQYDDWYHNGPRCRRCHEIWCEHCHPEIYEEECPSGQMTFEEVPNDDSTDDQ